jgi:hypothetical protein
MPALIAKEARNPCSIISWNIKEVRLVPSNYKVIPKFELNSIKFNYLDLFDLTTDEFLYMQQKDRVYKEILESRLGVKLHWNDALLNCLRSNNYSGILTTITNRDIEEEIERIIMNVP